ncbi:MAG: hypothetical protein MHM6MM_004713 [Cercozoa sp. M6MM]
MPPRREKKMSGPQQSKGQKKAKTAKKAQKKTRPPRPVVHGRFGMLAVQHAETLDAKVSRACCQAISQHFESLRTVFGAQREARANERAKQRRNKRRRTRVASGDAETSNKRDETRSKKSDKAARQSQRAVPPSDDEFDLAVEASDEPNSLGADGVVLGLNAVTRALETLAKNMTAGALCVLARRGIPEVLQAHLPVLCAKSRTPLLPLDATAAQLGTALGLRSVTCLFVHAESPHVSLLRADALHTALNEQTRVPVAPWMQGAHAAAQHLLHSFEGTDD